MITMTKRDFFIISIKLFGIFYLINLFTSNLSIAISIFLFENDGYSYLYVILSFIIVFSIFLLLILKADKIVTLLNLDKGFEEDMIELSNLKPSDIIKIGTFIIGGILIIYNIADLIIYLFTAFRAGASGTEYNAQNNIRIGISGLNILIGFLLLMNYNYISKLFTSKIEK